MAPLDMNIPDLQQFHGVATDEPETIESCHRKILELIAPLQQNPAPQEYIVNGGAVAKKIAHFYVRIGDLLLAEEEVAKAVSCYQTALQLDPRQWSARKGLLRAKASTNRDELTKAYLIDQLIEKPHDASLLNQLGNLHYKLQENARAVDCYQQAIDINPQDARNFYGMASAQQGLG